MPAIRINERRGPGTWIVAAGRISNFSGAGAAGRGVAWGARGVLCSSSGGCPAIVRLVPKRQRTEARANPRWRCCRTRRVIAVPPRARASLPAYLRRTGRTGAGPEKCPDRPQRSIAKRSDCSCRSTFLMADRSVPANVYHSDKTGETSVCAGRQNNAQSRKKASGNDLSFRKGRVERKHRAERCSRRL